MYNDLYRVHGEGGELLFGHPRLFRGGQAAHQRGKRQGLDTVCPGSSDPPEKIFSYICITKLGLHHLLLRYFRLNIIRLQSKIILGQVNSIG